MATHLQPPRTPRDLRAAVTAVQAAYDRLMAAPHPDPGLLLDLQHHTRELNALADQARGEAAHGRSDRIHCRCAGADRAAAVDHPARRLTHGVPMPRHADRAVVLRGGPLAADN
ncbi:hypothetical protein P3T36_007691 [Kitasatospora sp. MAP12-15]|uniref:hypothetical protein n=1 Tax=unclassified Kitasatospora TaxID=2633591 RepID=UPI002473759C|nr:hypothetical protein [Kitasatospora sp. MAP12-44]MDH6115559.1 hypothetical protein [Kitasatospora sp. MAP12-44]